MKTTSQFFQQMRGSPLFIRMEGYHRWAPLFIRLVIGFGFMDHGWAKLSRGPKHFEQLLVQIGAPFPYFTSRASPLVEIFGGLAIFVGAFVDHFSPTHCYDVGGYVYGASQVRIQFDKYNWSNARRSCLRSSGLRGGFVVYCGLTVLHSGRGGNLLSRFLDHLSKIDTFFSRSIDASLIFKSVFALASKIATSSARCWKFPDRQERFLNDISIRVLD
jgi:hypothetical protein